MKKLLLIPILLAALLSHAQTGAGLNMYPQCPPQKVTTKDTAILSVLASTVDGFKSVVFTQLTGPNTAIINGYSVAYISGLSAIVRANVTGTVPGLYTFSEVATSTKGNSVTATDSLIVTASSPGCPPPVVCPPARTAVSAQIVINGQAFAIPLAGIKVTYSDGSTQ